MFGFTVFMLLFFLQYFHAFNIKIPSKELDQRITLTINLQRFFSDIRASIIITDLLVNDLPCDLLKTIFGSVTVIDKSQTYSVPKNENMPSMSVIMVLSSPEKIESVLVNETWRNFDQFFIILDGNNNLGCDNAETFLMKAWNKYILNVIFICLDDHRILKLYSFNPFTSSAPIPWKTSVIPGISWTLLNQNYSSDLSIKNLFFDKTDNLSGHIIKVGVFDIPPYITYRIINGTKIFEGFDYEIIKTLVSNLNGNLIIDENIIRVPGQIDDENNKTLPGRVANGQFDFAIDSLILTETSKKVEFTYPFQQTAISVMTQYREFKIPAGHLFRFLFLPTAILFLFASILIYFLLLYVFKDPYSRNFIDILRFYLNLPLPPVSRTLCGRMVFVIALLSFTISNIIFQAHMEIALTSKNIARNVEGLEDLKEMNYKVLAGKFMESVMNHSGIKNTEIVVNNLNCSELRTWEAYADKEMTLRTLMADSCHLPKKSLISGMYLTYYTQRNWPIFPKINKKLQMLFEGGLTDYQMKKILKKYQRPIHQEVERNQPITMEHMIYIFYILIATVFVAVIVFISEIFIAHLFRYQFTVFEFVI